MAYCDFGPGTGFPIPRLLRHIHFHVSIWWIQPSGFLTLLFLCHVFERREWYCIVFKGKSSHSCWDFHITLVPRLLSNKRMPICIACPISLRRKKPHEKQSNLYQTASGSQFFKQMIQKDSFVEKQIKRKTSFQIPHYTPVEIKQISRSGQNWFQLTIYIPSTQLFLTKVISKLLTRNFFPSYKLVFWRPNQCSLKSSFLSLKAICLWPLVKKGKT